MPRVVDHHLPDVLALPIEVVDLPLPGEAGAGPGSGLEATHRSTGGEGLGGERRRLPGGEPEARDPRARSASGLDSVVVWPPKGG